MTVRAVFESLLRDGPRSRAELSRDTGISAPTISKAIAELLERDLVSETLISENSLGRPGMRLTVARARSRVLGIAVEEQTATLATSTLDGQVLSFQTIPIPSLEEQPAPFEQLISVVRSTIAESDGSMIGIGLCFGAQSETTAGRFPYRAAADSELVKTLSEAVSVPVISAQRGPALAVAEILVGKARNLSDFIMLDLSSDPTIGVCCDGQLLTGRDGLAGQLSVGSQEAGPAEDFLQQIAASVATLTSLLSSAAVFVHAPGQGASPRQLQELAAVISSTGQGRLSEQCRIERSSVRLLDAAIAIIVDSITQELGPRLNVALSSFRPATGV